MVSRSRISIRECRKDPAQLRQRSPKDGCRRKENGQASCAACLRFGTAESKVPPFLNILLFHLRPYFLPLKFGLFCLTHVVSYRFRYGKSEGDAEGAEVFDKSFVIFTAVCGIALPGATWSISVLGSGLT